MNPEDKTYEALIRTPFEQVIQLCYAADPYGSYTFNRLNKDKKWEVAQSLEHLVMEQGWSIEDFNNQLEIKFKE